MTPASASSMVKKLDELGLVTHEPYKGVKLTAGGRRVALEVLRHHRLLELYLAESLGVPWDRVHDEAEILEHVLSEELEELIAAKLGNPTHDPHGDPIPNAALEIEERPTEALASLATRRGRRVRARLGFGPGDAALPRRSSASRPATASRSSTASRSAARCSCGSTARCTRSAASWRRAMRVEPD